MLVLGAVSLTVTGAEALYADMGHFSAGPIRTAWWFGVFPALLLNYFGQGAYAIHFLASPASHGVDLATQNWFFLLVPEALRIPMVILATAATIIASQAVITGAYSMTNSAMQMGLLPRLHVLRTSETEAGQIYMPTVNMLLMVGVILLVAIFKNSGALQDAYGLAVTGTMSVTTALTADRGAQAVEAQPASDRARGGSAADGGPVAFFSANMLKLLTGGWVPVTIALGVIFVIATWIRGSDIVLLKARKDRIPLDDFLASIGRRPRQMVSGTAVYLTPEADLTPSALLHNLKHNGVLHDKNALVTVNTTSAPRVPADERATFKVINDHFVAVTLNFGYMETPGRARGPARLEDRRGRLRGHRHVLLPRPPQHRRRPRPRPAPPARPPVHRPGPQLRRSQRRLRHPARAGGGDGGAGDGVGPTSLAEFHPTPPPVRRGTRGPPPRSGPAPARPGSPRAGRRRRVR